ncbi:MAG: DUF5320 domain-containing protein [Okeania sp. SIO2D1]|nr:DUF5320 domain-containing protein [Okeania sp. SIO2D1]
MPEIGLGIGREYREFNTWTREWLYWYDQQENRYPSPDEALQQEKARAEQAQQELEQIKARLQQQGINWEELI